MSTYDVPLASQVRLGAAALRNSPDRKMRWTVSSPAPCWAASGVASVRLAIKTCNTRFMVSDRPPVGGIEACVSVRHVDENVRGREPARETPIEHLKLVENLLDADGVDVPEWPAPERRKADTEHRADVSVTRRPENAFFE